MAWTCFRVPTGHRTELDQVLAEDRISRQSHKIRDAATAGGPAGELYALIEGSDDAVKAADELLAKIGTKLPTAEAEKLHAQFKDEDERWRARSAGARSVCRRSVGLVHCIRGKCAFSCCCRPLETA